MRKHLNKKPLERDESIEKQFSNIVNGKKKASFVAIFAHCVEVGIF